jgi:hypothetical protein
MTGKIWLPNPETRIQKTFRSVLMGKGRNPAVKHPLKLFESYFWDVSEININSGMTNYKTGGKNADSAYIGFYFFDIAGFNGRM